MVMSQLRPRIPMLIEYVCMYAGSNKTLSSGPNSRSSDNRG